jgi:hypothetical protein
MHSPTAALSSQNLPGRCGNHAVLRFYLLHEPVIVAAASVIVCWNVPALAKYPALVLVSFAATLAICDLAIRRYRPTRFVFGMEPRQSATTAGFTGGLRDDHRCLGASGRQSIQAWMKAWTAWRRSFRRQATASWAGPRSLTGMQTMPGRA